LIFPCAIAVVANPGETLTREKAWDEMILQYSWEVQGAE
jgi:hypothetical protein